MLEWNTTHKICWLNTKKSNLTDQKDIGSAGKVSFADKLFDSVVGLFQGFFIVLSKIL